MAGSSSNKRSAMRWNSTTAAAHFKVKEFSGTESLCADFEFQVLIGPPNRTPPGDRQQFLDAQIGQPISFGTQTDSWRWFHGYVSEGSLEGSRDVTLTVVPWMWFLGRDRGHRTYLGLSIPKVIEAALQEHSFAEFRWDITPGHYQPVERIVRFDESTAGFVTRLLATAGIAWYWEQDPQGQGHKLVMTDGTTPPPAVPGAPLRFIRDIPKDVRWRLGLEEWQPGRTVTASAVRLADYDPAAPRVPANGSAEVSKPSGPGKLTRFEAPAGARSPADAKRLARIRSEQLRAEDGVIRGAGNATGLAPWRTFRTAAAEGEFLLTSVRHTASALPGRELYDNDFECIPATTPFRPPLPTNPPRIPGAFPGHVVGADGSTTPPAGSPVHTDERGRVRVKFAWHQPKEDSGWVRVAHPGGQMRIPRIGEEVYVIWEHGDPDRPVVIASSYPVADENLFPPAADPLPLVIRQPFPTGEKVNEIVFDSAKEKERLSIRAGNEALVEVGGEYTEVVAKDRKTVVKGNVTSGVEGSQRTVVRKNATELVRGNATKLVRGVVIEKSMQSRLVRSRKAIQLQAAKQIVLTSKTRIVIDAPEIVIGNGRSFIQIGRGGVVIEGKPFTKINCGASTSGPQLEEAEEPKKLPPPPKLLPKPKEVLLLPAPKPPLLLPKPR